MAGRTGDFSVIINDTAFLHTEHGRITSVIIRATRTCSIGLRDNASGVRAFDAARDRWDDRPMRAEAAACLTSLARNTARRRPGHRLFVTG